jgi:replicative DNA helicase
MSTINIPQANDIEMSVLGEIINGRIDIDTVCEEMFFDGFHRDVLKKIREIKSKRDVSANEMFLRLTTSGFDNIRIVRVCTSFSFTQERDVLILREKMAERALLEANRLSSESIYTGEDIGDVISVQERRLMEIEESVFGQQEAMPISEAVRKSIEEMHLRMERFKNGLTAGVATGLHDLNRLTGGFQNGDLVILAGRPSMGKTALMLHFAKSAKVPVTVFSLEMSDVRLSDRMILSETDIQAEGFRSGELDGAQVDKFERASRAIYSLPIYIDKNTGVNVGYIKSRARILHRQGKCEIVMIDYLQLIREDTKAGRNREQAVADMSKELKNLARELNIPVILLCQLNRELEKRTGHRPMLSDLRESGAIEQDADVVLFVHRPEYYGVDVQDKAGNSEVNYGEVIVAKQRNGQRDVVCKFKHNGSLTQFYDYNFGFTPPVNFYDKKDDKGDDLPF